MAGAKTLVVITSSSFCLVHRGVCFFSSLNAFNSLSLQRALFKTKMSANANGFGKKRTMKQATLFSAFGGAPASKKRAIHAASLDLSSTSPAAKARDDTINPCKKSSSAASYTIFCDLDGVLVDFNAGVTRLLGKPSDQIPGRVLWPAIHRQSDFYQNLPWTSDGEALWEALRSSIISIVDENTTAEEPTTTTTTPHNIGAVHILTGVSHGPGVSQQKYLWCLRELCVEVQHVNMAAPKRKHERVGAPHLRNNGMMAQAGDATTLQKRKIVGVTKVITCWSKNKHCESGPGQ